MRKFVVAVVTFVLILSGCATGVGDDNAQSLPKATPGITEAPKEPTIEVISEFETPLVDKTQERVDNIILACEAIHGFILQPGEEFSFNEVVGVRSPERGYQKAPMFVGDELEDGYGGGVCQLSTTVYQAALGAGFEITERNEHTEEVTYIELGDDATVAYGTEDLRFINTSGESVTFEAQVDGVERVYVKITKEVL